MKNLDCNANKWICVGQFGAPHGVRGEIKLTAFTENPATLKTLIPLCLGPGGASVVLDFTRPMKTGFYVRVKGVADREKAAHLTSKKLYVPREALPAQNEEDSYYLSDLIGLAVVAPDGETRGRVKAVPDYGAGTLLELALDAPLAGLGRTVLVPFEKAYVPRVNIVEGLIEVDLDGWVAAQIIGGDKMDTP